MPASAIWGNPGHQKAVSLAVDHGELQCSPVQMTRAQFLDQQGWAQLHETDRQTDRHVLSDQGVEKLWRPLQLCSGRGHTPSQLAPAVSTDAHP